MRIRFEEEAHEFLYRITDGASGGPDTIVSASFPLLVAFQNFPK